MTVNLVNSKINNGYWIIITKPCLSKTYNSNNDQFLGFANKMK